MTFDEVINLLFFDKVIKTYGFDQLYGLQRSEIQQSDHSPLVLLEKFAILTNRSSQVRVNCSKFICSNLDCSTLF